MKINKMLIVVIAALMVLPGCETAKKKFVRKKKQEPIKPQIYTQKEYVKPYSNSYYYASHFNLWKVWQEDLIKLIDANQKRRRMAGDEVLQHLTEMHGYLKEEKAAELQVFIDDIRGAVGDLDAGGESSKSRARFTLERTLRELRSKFTPSDISESIKPDVLDV